MKPRRHHFLPQFYQKRWATQGFVSVFRRPYGEVTVHRKPTSAVGFELDLYADRTTPEGIERDEIESRFLNILDSGASRVLRDMEQGQEPPPDKSRRSDWARFIMSLIHRAPSRVDHLFERAAAHRPEILADLRKDFPEFTDKSDDEIFPEREIGKSHLVLLKELMDSSRVGSCLTGMVWTWVDCSDAKYPLVTSDRPLMRSDGLAGEDGFVVLPCGPTALFIAATRKQTIDRWLSLGPTKLVNAVDDAIIRQAEAFVIARDESQSRFVENRLMTGRAEKRDRAGEMTWILR